ncbi:MAG: VanZ family protein [Myxococcota bacterium]|jgi:VanZ family protein
MSNHPMLARERASKFDLGLILLLIAQVVILTYLGLAPFSFSPANQVEALDAAPGLEFDTTGVAISAGEFDGRAQFPSNALTVHLMIQPNDEPRSGLGTIFSIEDDQHESHLLVAQWKTWLVVRVRDTAGQARGYWEIDAEDFESGKSRFVTITSSPEAGTTIYVDGVPTGNTRKHSIIGDGETLAGRLLLGCLANGSAGWRGQLQGFGIANSVIAPERIADHYAAVRERAFSTLRTADSMVVLYDFAEINTGDEELLYSVPNVIAQSALGALEIPRTFAPLHPEVLGIPKLRDMKADWFLQDLLRNIAGFVPLGLVASLLLLRNKNQHGYAITLKTAALGGLLSTGIEIVQIALPMRSSSLSDLTLNIIGAMVGALIGLAFRHTQIAATESVPDS